MIFWRWSETDGIAFDAFRFELVARRPDFSIQSPGIPKAHDVFVSLSREITFEKFPCYRCGIATAGVVHGAIRQHDGNGVTR